MVTCVKAGGQRENEARKQTGNYCNYYQKLKEKIDSKTVHENYSDCINKYDSGYLGVTCLKQVIRVLSFFRLHTSIPGHWTHGN